MRKSLLLLFLLTILSGEIIYGQSKTILIFSNKEELKEILSKTEIKELNFDVNGLSCDSEVETFKQNLIKFGDVLKVDVGLRRGKKRHVSLVLSERFNLRVFRKFIGTNNYYLKFGNDSGDCTILD